MRRIRRRKPVSEAETAADVARGLHACGWKVYPETAGVDLIAKRPGDTDVLAVEVKATINLQVVRQAHRCVRGCGFAGVYVAVPYGLLFAPYLKILCAHLGIGVICVHPLYDATTLHVNQPEKRQRPMHPGERSVLEQTLQLCIPPGETYTSPGKKSPRQWTPFRLREYVLHGIIRDNPGITPREALVEEARLGGFKPKPTRGFRDYVERGVWDTLAIDPQTDAAIIAKPWEEAGDAPLALDPQYFDTTPDVFAPRDGGMEAGDVIKIPGDSRL